MAIGYLLSRVTINACGFLLPAYSTYKAVRADDDEQTLAWAKYWIVMGIYAAAESVADVLLFWTPLYYEVKLAFVLWLSLPYTQGASVIYSTYVEPLLIKKERDIDMGLARSRSVMKRASVEWSRKGVFMLQQAVLKSLMTAEVEPEYLAPKRSANDIKRIERKLTKLADEGAPEPGADTSVWIKKERTRLQSLLKELDKLADDMGDNPPPKDRSRSGSRTRKPDAPSEDAVRGHAKESSGSDAANGRRSRNASNSNPKGGGNLFRRGHGREGSNGGGSQAGSGRPSATDDALQSLADEMDLEDYAVEPKMLEPSRGNLGSHALPKSRRPK
ncbi:TB2/DP1, HVA22 family-domain-containing protein [Entophlyctis helioformis]|nr:TB2/DP1, HVA22 family-domain-containing protein [Entophlyctis helioformis]